MNWMERYPKETEPTLREVEGFVGSALWTDLRTYLEESYRVQPKTSYSSCSGQPGWNVKYQKSAKSLCTLYPMPGYFIALVVIGEKERTRAELLLPACTEYVQNVYQTAGGINGARWLMIEVKDPSTLRDVQNLISLRVPPKRTA